MKRLSIISTTAALAVLATAAVAPAAGAVTVRQVEGTILSVDRAASTFRLRDSQRGTFRIRVTRRTSFERIAGLAGLRAGMTRIEATIRRSDGRWVARHVERSGGGGAHGGRDDD